MKLREKRLLEVMAIKKMSRAELAASIGVSQGYLVNVIKGRRRLNFKHSKKLIELLGADLASRVIDWNGMGIDSPFGEA